MKNIFKKGIALVLSLGILFAVALPTSTFAAISLVQTKSQGNGYVNSFTMTPTSNITAGSLLLMCVTAGDANTVLSLVDSKSQTWTLATSTKDSLAGNRQTWLYYAKNAGAGATTMTWTWGASQFADASVFFREYSGASTTNPLDQVAANNDAATTPTSHNMGTTAATTYANELVVGCGGYANTDSATSTVGTGYGNFLEQKASDRFTFGIMQDKTVTSTGTQTGTYNTTIGVTGVGLLATFVDATQPAVATSTNKNMLLSFGF